MPLYRNPLPPTVPITGGGEIVWLPDLVDAYGGGSTKLDGIPTWNSGDGSFIVPQQSVVGFNRNGVTNFYQFVPAWGPGVDDDYFGWVIPDDTGGGYAWKRMGSILSTLVGEQVISMVTDEIIVAFPSQVPATWAFKYLEIVNIADGAPSGIAIETIEDESDTGFTVIVSAPALTNNYILRWAIEY